MKARSAPRTLLLVLLALLAGSCTLPSPSVKVPPPPRVWPAAPDEPRIAFVGYLRGPADVGAKPALLRHLTDWLTGSTGEEESLRKPFAVALDETGGICLTDSDTKAVIWADPVRHTWRRYETAGTLRFSSPVAVARRHGILYVADSELARVFALGEDGRLLFSLGQPLQRPVGLALVGERLYVVDALNHAVFAFTLDGRLEFRFGTRGDGPGEFNYPTCVADDGYGHLLVTDTMNCRVQVFDHRGNFLSAFGSRGDTSGHFSRPKGVAADAAGHTYVVDAVFDNFQIFDRAGRLLLNVGEGGDQAGEFGLPAGIAISAEGRIFVADAFNHRVQIFQILPGRE